MSVPRVLAGTVVCVALAAAVLLAADLKVTPVITPDGKVVASFTAPSAMTSDTREVVRSAVPVTFAFSVELKRPATLWFDKTLGAATVQAKVKFDTLEGRYLVSKQLNDHVIWSDQTDSEDQMRAWITQFDRIPIETRDPLEQNGEYYVQVKLHVSPRQHFPLWPFGRDDGSGRADFTFIH